MRSILGIAFFGAVEMGLLLRETRSGAKLPNWTYALAAIGMVLIGLSSTRYSDSSDTARGMGLVHF